MIASGNSQSRGEVIDYAPNGGLPIQRCPEGSDAANKWDPNYQVNVEPVDMLVPIGWMKLSACCGKDREYRSRLTFCDGTICNVRFIRSI